MQVSAPRFGLQTPRFSWPGYEHASPSLPFGLNGDGPVACAQLWPFGAMFTLSVYGPAFVAFVP